MYDIALNYILLQCKFKIVHINSKDYYMTELVTVRRRKEEEVLQRQRSQYNVIEVTGIVC